MARIEIDGIGIEYELLGPAGAPAIAVTPGGRMSKDAPGVRELGEALARGGRRVLLHDRPNCGQSDLCFTGETESMMQGEALIGLIRTLNLGPTALAGGSAGSRTSLFAAAHDPEIVSHLLQWWISAGTISLMSLGNSYCCEPAVAASYGGMEAVAGLPTFAEQIARNPRNREILLAQDVDEFVATMERWAGAFVPTEGSLVPGMTADRIARLTMPALVFRGSARDIYHPDWTSERLDEMLPNSRLVDPPWTEQEFLANWAEATRTGEGHLALWPRLAEPILAFTAS
ncbi:MAG: alpha/beta hydrolase [Novosphingobium sp.]|nr:alpha/beta hydrolase [Novosphingobium sp.]